MLVVREEWEFTSEYLFFFTQAYPFAMFGPSVLFAVD